MTPTLQTEALAAFEQVRGDLVQQFAKGEIGQLENGPWFFDCLEIVAGNIRGYIIDEDNESTLFETEAYPREKSAMAVYDQYKLGALSLGVEL